MEIGNKKIDYNEPTFIIAELSANHLQNFDIAVETIKAMKDSGADATSTTCREDGPCCNGETRGRGI